MTNTAFRRLRIHAAAAMCATALLAGCAVPPQSRPIRLGPVDTGQGSLEYVRRQLMGTWEFVSLALYPSPGTTRRIEGSGSLVYDDFGNLTIDGRLKSGDVSDASNAGDAGAAASRLLHYTGRAVIDPERSALRLLDVEGQGIAESAAPLLAPAALRHFRIERDLLHISVTNDRGETTATVVWRRAPVPTGLE